MFKKNFIRLCSERRESPSYVCSKIGITAAAFSQWTEQTVPRKVTQQRAADYFGVSIDYLLGKEDDRSLDDGNINLKESMGFDFSEDVDGSLESIKEKCNPKETGLDDYEKKLIGTFRETSIDGKIRILNAAEEIKNEIEKNNNEKNTTLA